MAKFLLKRHHLGVKMAGRQGLQVYYDSVLLCIVSWHVHTHTHTHTQKMFHLHTTSRFMKLVVQDSIPFKQIKRTYVATKQTLV
jgi:hypothetical protein